MVGRRIDLPLKDFLLIDDSSKTEVLAESDPTFCLAIRFSKNDALWEPVAISMTWFPFGPVKPDSEEGKVIDPGPKVNDFFHYDRRY